MATTPQKQSEPIALNNERGIHFLQLPWKDCIKWSKSTARKWLRETHKEGSGYQGKKFVYCGWHLADHIAKPPNFAPCFRSFTKRPAGAPARAPTSNKRRGLWEAGYKGRTVLLEKIEQMKKAAKFYDPSAPRTCKRRLNILHDYEEWAEE
jgi:hypothetical protein